MRIIDAHAHLEGEPGYLDRLLSTMDACGIEKVCISGLGELFGFGTNEDVRQAFTRHPDRVIGAYYIRPGLARPEDVDQAAEQGFKLIKVTLPRAPYDDPSFFSLWERCLANAMPVLFHTGIVAPSAEGRGEGISSWAMHPMRVEPITREFPELPVILAHLGMNWNMDAAELARMRKNVYVDLTGEPDGWRVRLDRFGADTYLWWPGAFAKVIFGTDVHCSKIPGALAEDVARLDRLGISPETRERIFSGNILRLLGLEE